MAPGCRMIPWAENENEFMKTIPLRCGTALLLALVFAPSRVRAANPIITDVFTADPAPLVVGDTVYLYCG